MLTWSKVAQSVFAMVRREEIEHWRTRHHPGGHMHDERSDRNPALAELHQKLSDGLARAGLNKTQLARQTGLGRTTVSQAFRSDGPVPSPSTVAALACVLKLPQEALLELRRTAEAPASGPVVQDGLGKPIDEWEPHDLEVHPAGPALGGHDSSSPRQRVLPGYVRRAHDGALAQAVRDAQAGRSQMVVLVGTSSTGKTRACWEAVQPLAEVGWRLWHPFDPTRAQAALDDLERVRPRTVVWLNEAQHYLGNAAVGERIAAAVHALLTDAGRMPVLVLGTLWPEYERQYTALPAPDTPDPHSRVRELLAGRTVCVPDSFGAEALHAASLLAEDGDRLLADALTRASTHGRVTQDLAGAPELLLAYEHAAPAARAVLEAAMDARRLGVGLHLPQAFLTDAAPDYLNDTDYEDLPQDWAESAFAELTRPVHGRQAPLRRTAARPARRLPGTPSPAAVPGQAAGPEFRLADYLEQHGRTTRWQLCPPASFWHAAHTDLTRPDDLYNLAEAAGSRCRRQWKHLLRQRAADAGHPDAIRYLAELRKKAGNQKWAVVLYRQAVKAGDTYAMRYLAELQAKAGDWEGAEALARQAVDAGDTHGLNHLAMTRAGAGDWEGAEALARQAADAGDTHGLNHLAMTRAEAGDREGAEALYHQAADAGDAYSLYHLAMTRAEAGDREGAEALYHQAADAGNSYALYRLAVMREKAGDQEGAQALVREAAGGGHKAVLYRLAVMREKAGDWTGAEALYHQAADAGDPYALYRVAVVREKAGDWEGAEAVYRQAVDTSDTGALIRLAELREIADRISDEAPAYSTDDEGHCAFLYSLAETEEEAGDWRYAENLASQAADAGVTDVLFRLALTQRETDSWESCEALTRQAADSGDTGALYRLAVRREAIGDREGAETFYRQAADAGHEAALYRLGMRREKTGDRDRAKALYRQAIDAGATDALIRLAVMQEQEGGWQSCEALTRQAADSGDTDLLYRLTMVWESPDDWMALREKAFWPYGLDPDGTPTSPWQ
ncbi:tetratricopeptide repeat protein [Streptomyces canus]|uniref:tetratricopeptide repeat protein n=1 Tax=Streptomyces canus TaxID=58343 RepID=UPI0033B04C44